ncbi:hypothetical protein WR25_25293 [Diploscapter pachys]|uniref:Uncharacterized protein n=1 Tax=Diploscapter pachys TaxID=2018661 RepID=A0A2A2M4B8_9BILA|nr:hypothetical protein WR25_25293 [Diploscapter pachys]
MAGAARQRVENARSIDEVGGRQDQRRVARPEQQPPAPQIGPPRQRIDPLGIIVEPARHQRLGDRRALRARRHGRQVSQPREAVDVIGKRPAPVAALERERVDRVRLALERQLATQQRMAAPHVAHHGIVRHRNQLQRIATLQPHRVDRRTPRACPPRSHRGHPARRAGSRDDGGATGRSSAHQPRSAAILAA